MASGPRLRQDLLQRRRAAGRDRGDQRSGLAGGARPDRLS